MSFRVVALPAAPFAPLATLSDDALAERNVRVALADKLPGFPCRVSLADAAPGTRVYLLNHEHQPVNTPYRSAHAIYVAHGAVEAMPDPGVVPEVLRVRLLSVRAFDSAGMMVDADVVDGTEAVACFERLLRTAGVSYLHVHFAKRGCYAARIERA